MENRKYKVSRDNIYVGEVGRTYFMDHYNYKQKHIFTGGWRSYRSMLFVLNEKKLSNDLLYQSPNYPILFITDDEICLSPEKESIVIGEACNLATLLECFGYNKELSFKDIMKIRTTFFTGKFIIDPKELEQQKIQSKDKQPKDHRAFFSVSESVLPIEYLNVLNKRGDISSTDAFVPHREEGPIKKLKRF